MMLTKVTINECRNPDPTHNALRGSRSRKSGASTLPDYPLSSARGQWCLRDRLHFVSKVNVALIMLINGISSDLIGVICQM